MRFTRSVAGLGLLAMVASAGCKGEGPAAATSKSAAPTAPARQVRVVPAGERALPRTVVTTGTLAAEEQVVLGTKVAGRLALVTVDLGSRVRRGHPVARIDDGDYRLRVEQAEAAQQQARARLGLRPQGTDERVDPEQTALVRQARALLDEARLARERGERLWEQQLIARSQLDADVAALEVAEGRYQDALEEVRNRQAVLAQRRSEREIARQQLADTVLRSPLDGAVSQRLASVGEYLAPGAPVVTLVRIDPLRLRLAVPEREAVGLQVGQGVRVTVEGDDTVHEGRVARLSPAIQEQNRTLAIEAEIPNPRGGLRPGAFARAEIVTRAPRPVVTVPATAIVTFAGIEKVLSAQDGKTVEMRVQTGRRVGGEVEIISGLTAGQLVVVEPGILTGGQPITVVR